MEQSLGKNIAMHRKAMGLTQDQLAERLGVTAQAVSKWENDQPCPDITMLPKLAEIFHTSTDALLGLKQTKVHEAEVVTDEDDQSSDMHIHFENDKGSGWEFRWDNGRRSAIGFAVFVLLVGLLTLADSQFGWKADFWDICWPSALLVFGITLLFHKHKISFMPISCALLGGYFLVKNLQLLPLHITGDVIFPILIVLFGISLLVDALRKPKKPKFRLIHKGDKKKPHSECDITDEHFDCSMSFGEETRYIQLPRLSGGEISVCFGDYTVDLSGCDTIAEGCEIDASCAFGELTLLVPSRYRVESDSCTSFGSFDVEGQSDANPVGVINLDASASFGQITVKYI
jgi:transcriptional regulator with XRE-family HTH domain